MTTTPEGWYPDAQQPLLRYWDGTAWTPHTTPYVVQPEERISVLAILLAFVPLIGIVAGVLTLAKGEQPRTGAIMLGIGLTMLVVSLGLRSMGGA